jgi:hypothetical protein
LFGICPGRVKGIDFMMIMINVDVVIVMENVTYVTLMIMVGNVVVITETNRERKECEEDSVG